MYKCKIQPGLVGCHEENRDGYGVNGHDVFQLTDDIFELGFDLNEVKAVAAEINTANDKTIDFNYDMVAKANGMLAPILGNLVFASLCGSHTNQVLRGVVAGMPHTNLKMTVDGKLNVNKIRLTDPVFADAVEQGVEWSVISSCVIKEFPNLPTLVQAAGNAAGQVAKAEHEMQLCRRLHNTYLQLQNSLAPSHTVNFKDVKERALASKPRCNASLASMYNFVLRYSGGEKAELLKESEAFIKAMSPTTRAISPEFWDALSTDFKGLHQCLRFRHAALKLAYVAPFNVVNGESMWVKHVDVRRCSKPEMLALTLAADTLLTECREIMLKNNIDVASVYIELGRLDMNVVAHVFEKTHKDHVGHDSISHAAHEFIVAVRKKLDINISSPWEACAKVENVTKLIPNGDLEAMVKMRGLNVDPSHLLLEKGYHVGLCVMRKKDKKSRNHRRHQQHQRHAEAARHHVCARLHLVIHAKRVGPSCYKTRP